MLVLPTGRTIRFEETSRDVIHSFWVPELLFKRDVFPGNVRNVFEVTIDQEGAYVGRCAELCGTYHSMMNFELRAVSARASTTSSSRRSRRARRTQAGARGRSARTRCATTTSPFPTGATSELQPPSTGGGTGN